MSSLPEVMTWWRARFEAKAKPTTLVESEERLAAAKAQLAELELEEQQGNLARKADVIAAWRSVHERVRGRLLAVPAKAAPALVGMKRAVDVQLALERYIAEVIAELRDFA